MAESFSKAVKRSVGIISANTNGTISTFSNVVSGISTSGIAIGDYVLNPNYRIGAKISSIGIGSITVTENSFNTGYAAGQQVDISRPVSVLSATEKNIIIGGTLANLTNSQVAASVVVSTGITDVMLLADVPVPPGSSVVISDAGKTVLGAGDTVSVFTDTNSALDVNFSFLTGVN